MNQSELRKQQWAAGVYDRLRSPEHVKAACDARWDRSLPEYARLTYDQQADYCLHRLRNETATREQALAHALRGAA